MADTDRWLDAAAEEWIGMANGGGSAPGDPAAETEAVLAAARRSIVGTGKAASRRLARLDRLEKKIKRLLKEESKRRRQLEEARAGLADLVARVTTLVESDSRAARTRDAVDAIAEPEPPAPAPAPRARRSGSTTARPRRTSPGGGASRGRRS